MPRPPVKMRIAGFHPEAAGKRDLRHVERAAHQRMVDLRLPQLGHSPGALRLVLEDAGRALVLRSRELSAPDGETVQHASRQRFETPRIPALFTGRRIEGRSPIEMVEVRADHGGFFQPDAVVTHEIGNAARWIDAVVRTVRDARLRGDDLDAAL